MTELLKMINAPDSRAHFHLHDPATIAAAAINAAGTMGNGFMSGATSRGNIRRQYRYNKRLMEEQQEINLENWNRQNAYNTPAAQASRLKAAGLNPSILTQGSGSSAAAGNAAPVSSPSPQGVSPTSPANEFAGLSHLGTDFTSAIKDLSEAKEKTANTELMNRTMGERIMELSLKNYNQALLNHNQEKTNQFLDMFGEQKASLQVQLLGAQFLDAISLDELQGAEKLESIARAIESMSSADLNEASKTRLKTLLGLEQKHMEADVELKRAQRAEALSNAAYARARAMTEDQVRQFVVATQKFNAECAKHRALIENIHSAQDFFDLLKRDAGFEQEVMSYLKELRRQGVITQQQFNAAKVDNIGHELVPMMYAWDNLLPIFQASSDVFYKLAGGLGSLMFGAGTALGTETDVRTAPATNTSTHYNHRGEVIGFDVNSSSGTFQTGSRYLRPFAR